jgi:hypothetical protein
VLHAEILVIKEARVREKGRHGGGGGESVVRGGVAHGR